MNRFPTDVEPVTPPAVDIPQVQGPMLQQQPAQDRVVSPPQEEEPDVQPSVVQHPQQEHTVPDPVGTVPSANDEVEDRLSGTTELRRSSRIKKKPDWYGSGE